MQVHLPVFNIVTKRDTRSKRVTHENGEITEHCMRTVHAEQNAICQAAESEFRYPGATIYRMTPCRTCAMLLINCGIRELFVNANITREKIRKKCSGKRVLSWFINTMSINNTQTKKEG